MADLLRIYSAASPPPEEVSVFSKNWSTNHELPHAIPTSNESSTPSRPCRSTRFLCMLWMILAAVAYTLVAGAVAGIMYLIFRFKIPNYSINRLALSAFKVDGNLTVRASFVVTITADNPNAKMGIYYLDVGRLSAFYDDNSLVSGSFPVFYEGGTTCWAAGDALRQQKQETGTVPLTMRGDVPVQAKVGKLKLWRATARARCDLLVDARNPNALIGILSNSCSFKFKL